MKTIPCSKSNGSQGIFLFVGQAGCQTGSSLWKLFNAEHSVQPDGFGFPEDSYKADHICFYKDSIFYKEDQFHRNFCYYEVKKTGKYVPRTMFLDLEPTVIDEIRTGSYKNLFSENLSFHEYSKVGDGAGIFSRAYNTIGRCIINNIMNAIRHLAEKSERLNVVNIARSYGGGTGSGLGSILLEKLKDQYSKLLLSEVNILNSGGGRNPILEPYNTLLGLESSCSSGGITFLYNNSALKNICFNELRVKKPLFHNMNELLCHAISGIYSSERFPGYGCCNMYSIMTNLIPYPRIQFAVCSMAPILPKIVTKYEPHSKPVDLINSIISNKNTMFDINLNTGSFISCCMIYRGAVSPFDISSSSNIMLNTNKIKMVEWSPRGIKNGHSPLNVVEISDFNLGFCPLHMTMLSNHTNISNSIANECKDVHVMLKKKAFLHWYLEHGMEEDDFKSALENAMILSLDYQEIDNSPDYALNLLGKGSNSILELNNKEYNKQRIKEENIDLLLSSRKTIGDGNEDPSTKSKIESLEESFKIEIIEENSVNLKNILASMTETDRDNLILLGKTKGIDISFLTNFGNGKLEIVDLEMIETLTALMDMKEIKSEISEKESLNIYEIKKETCINSVREAVNNMTDKEKEDLIFSSKLLGIFNEEFLKSLQTGEINEGNFEMFKTLLEYKNKDNTKRALNDIIKNMTKEEKVDLILLAKSQGIDDFEFFNSLERGEVNIENIETLSAMAELMDKYTGYLDVDINKSFDLKSDAPSFQDSLIKPQSIEIYTNAPKNFLKEYQGAIETIEPFSTVLYRVKININQVLCALSTRRSYEESFVSCSSPKTTLTRVNEFQKRHAKLYAELSKLPHSTKGK